MNYRYTLLYSLRRAATILQREAADSPHLKEMQGLIATVARWGGGQQVNKTVVLRANGMGTTPLPFSNHSSASVLTLVVTTPCMSKTAPPDVFGSKMRESEGAKALLLEIIRRAAYDWVLYRSSHRLDRKQLAEEAYTWLFLEDERHANWMVRAAEEKLLTSFVVICAELELNIEKVRGYIRRLTPDRVMSSGRPPENSRASDHSPSIQVHAVVPDADGDSLSDFDSFFSFGDTD